RRGSGADRNSRNIPSCRTRDDGSRPALGASNGSADCGSSGGLVRSFARLAVSRESIGRPPPRAFHSGHRRDLCFKMNWGSNDAWSDFARTGGHLTGETDAAFGYLAFAGVVFHATDKNVRACIAPAVLQPAHLPLALATPTFLQMAAGFPNFKPCPGVERPFDASLFRRLALFEEALQEGA